MSNTLIIDSLNTLFSMSNTAVLGAQEQFVAFMNPAAQELFRGDRTNHKLSELLPVHITEATATEFVTSATIEKRHVIISVTSFGAFRLFSLVPQDENALRAGAQFAPFLASLNAFRALTTYFSDYAMQLSDVRFRRNARRADAVLLPAAALHAQCLHGLRPVRRHPRVHATAVRPGQRMPDTA